MISIQSPHQEGADLVKMLIFRGLPKNPILGAVYSFFHQSLEGKDLSPLSHQSQCSAYCFKIGHSVFSGKAHNLHIVLVPILSARFCAAGFPLVLGCGFRIAATGWRGGTVSAAIFYNSTRQSLKEFVNLSC